MTTAYEVRVTGRVQGVFYRSFMSEEAELLGVTGWVRNEPDGSVAAHVEGDTAAVEMLVERCRGGPPSARVDHLDAQPTAATGATAFEVR